MVTEKSHCLDVNEYLDKKLEKEFGYVTYIFAILKMRATKVNSHNGYLNLRTGA